jgi:hypothetical protein
MLKISAEHMDAMAQNFDWSSIYNACQEHLKNQYPNSELIGDDGKILVELLISHKIKQLSNLKLLLDYIVQYNVTLPMTHLTEHLPDTEHKEGYRVEALCLAIEKGRISMAVMQ